MTKIIYLLGAGASATVLPINRKVTGDNAPRYINDEFKDFRDFLVHHKVDKDLIERIDRLLKAAKQMGTPDLCAKYLLEIGDQEGYGLMTRFISNYFTWKQTELEILSSQDGNIPGCEIRALSFLTTISKNKRLPSNIRILSWNYDGQIEIAAERLKLKNSGTSSKVQGFSSWPNIREGEDFDIRKDVPFLFHINGIAGYEYSPKDFAVKVDDFKAFDGTSESLLSFAWEDNDNCEKRTFTDQRRSIVQRMVAGTNILVVIGYTFPFFNRDFDKLIFQSMGGDLKTIYIQDPTYEGSQLREQFDLGRNIEIKPAIKDTHNYYIPYEL